MIIKSVELKDFRNYEVLSMDFSKNTNILYGANAQGKTNVLEALYVCATTRSHRPAKDKDMIKFGSNEAHIRIIVEKSGIDHRIDMHLKKSKSKGVAIDGVPIKKSSELLGFMNVVAFSPEDLAIIKNGPSERRHFMDIELCQLDKVYMHNLSSYNKVIMQRNALLKQVVYNSNLLETISVWDEQLITYAGQIIDTRQQFINELNEIVNLIHKSISGGKEDIVLNYECNTKKDRLSDELKAGLNRDIKLKMTGCGPHRDDIGFVLGGEDLRKYGSQGQQRTAALSLKLAEIELVKKHIKDEPVLLLDDVLSELDRERQNKLIDCINQIQTIITCTGLEEFVKNRAFTDRIYHVVSGNISEET